LHVRDYGFCGGDSSGENLHEDSYVQDLGFYRGDSSEVNAHEDSNGHSTTNRYSQWEANGYNNYLRTILKDASTQRFVAASTYLQLES
jgi:hypothetical protein